MWVSVIISTIFYIVLGKLLFFFFKKKKHILIFLFFIFAGILGAMAYQMDASSDILSILSANGKPFFAYRILFN